MLFFTWTMEGFLYLYVGFWLSTKTGQMYSHSFVSVEAKSHPWKPESRPESSSSESLSSVQSALLKPKLSATIAWYSCSFLSFSISPSSSKAMWSVCVPAESCCFVAGLLSYACLYRLRQTFWSPGNFLPALKEKLSF